MFDTKILENNEWTNKLFDSLEITAEPADVLFVTNQLTIPKSLCDELDIKGLSSKKVAVDDFLTGMFEPEQTGTIVLDTTDVIEDSREMLCNIIRRMEYANTPTILLNDKISFPINNFRLVTKMESASLCEIAGRIETNLKHRSNRTRQTESTKRTEGLSEDISEQMKMAGKVQRDFLPRYFPNSDRFHWAAFFEPADWVSGDIYDVQRLDEDNIGFYVADAVGHSVPAALLTIFIKQAIVMRKTYGNKYEIFEPAEVVTNLNEKMCEQKLSGCSFATVCYCLLNIRTRKLTYCRGGHPYPILVRDGKPVQLESKGGLVGVFDNNDFEQRTVQLEHNDKIFIYSDGAEDVTGSRDESETFEFTDDFLQIAKLNIEEMVDRFGRIASSQNRSAEQVDDITAIGMQVL